MCASGFTTLVLCVGFSLLCLCFYAHLWLICVCPCVCIFVCYGVDGPCNHVESFCCYKCALLNIFLSFSDEISFLLDVKFTGLRLIGASALEVLFFISSALLNRNDAPS